MAYDKLKNFVVPFLAVTVRVVQTQFGVKCHQRQTFVLS